MPDRQRIFSTILFSLLILPSFVLAHVAEGEGRTLQLYSYYTSNPPRINACLTDATSSGGTEAVPGTDNDEWKDAYIRKVKIVSTNNVDTLDGAMFFMNDDSYLYVGMTTNFNNSSNNTYIEFAFDQGIGGGNHNDVLEGGGTGINNGEYAARVYPNKGYAVQKRESSFDGTSWVQQNNGTEAFTGYGKNYGGSFVQVEFRIPLNGNSSASDNASFLNVTSTSELGLYISFYAQGGDVYFRWPETNGDITNASTAPGWADLKLGVNRSYVTFYSTVNVNGNPVIDGNITGGVSPDDAWRGAYLRNIVLTNFAGSSLNAVLYSVDDYSGNDCYVGLRVFDNENNADDYCQIYQEQDPSATPATTRNYILDNGTENSLIADENAFTLVDDRYWNGTSWAADNTNAAQNARGAWYGAGSYYEYEFLIDRNGGNDGDDQDIYMVDGSRMGFLIKYHDAAGSGSDYFWEFSPNADAIEIDMNQNVYVATGWPDMQLGAPYVQVIYPEDESKVEGVVNVRIFAQDENADGIDSASFYRKSAPGTKFTLTRIAGTNEYSGNWDVSSLSNGADTLVFEVGDDDGLVTERLANLTISNGTGASTPPTVSIISPAAGSTVGGTATINFSASATNATIVTREISIDGAAYTATSTATSHTWSTGGLTDGNHTVQIKVTDSNGRSTETNSRVLVVNNSPTVALVAPAADSVVSGTVVVIFNTTRVAPATITAAALSVDGGTFTATSTATTDTLDTQGLTEGAHSIQIRVTDSNGKTGLSELRNFVVKNSPTVTLGSPAADSLVSGTLLITFTATPISPATIASTWISVDGGTLRATSTGSSDTLDTRNLTDGSHTIQIKAVDSNGKDEVSIIRKFVIRNKPTVSITAPAADSVVSGTLLVTFTATPVAPATIASTWISVDGGVYRATSTGSNDTLDTRSLTEGSHIAQIKAIDSNGKEGVSGIRKFEIRNKPAVTVTAPAADTVVSGTLLVTFTATPVTPATIASTWISVDGGAYRATSTGSTDTLDTRNLTEGSHTMQIKAIDSNGKEGFSDIRKFEIRNKPTVTIIAPAADSVVSGTLLVTFNATSVAPATIASTWISVDGGAYRATSTGSNDTLDTRSLTEGSHIAQIKVIDSSGKEGFSDIRKFMIKNTPSVVLVSPVADTILTGTVPILFSASAVTPASIVKRNIFIDGKLLDTATTDSTYTWNTLNYNDGQHSIQVRVIDSNGKTAVSDLITVTLFNTPIVTIAPNDTSGLSGIDTIRFTVNYPQGSSRDTTEIAYNGGLWLPSTTDSTYIWITTDFSDGNHIVQVRATATNGKTGYSQIRNYSVKNTPVVNITAPAAGEALNGVYTIRFTVTPVSPAVIAKREISIDGGKWYDSLTDTAFHLLNTSGMENGTHSVQVRGYDNKGRIGFSNIRMFVVDNEAPLAADPKVIYTDETTIAKSGTDVLVTILVKDNLVGLKSDSAVILTSASIDESSPFIAVMRDNGLGGDRVKGDNVFSSLITISTDSTGAIGYSVTTTDRLGNDTTVTSAIILDNTPPVMAYVLNPVPEKGIDVRSGTTYFRRLVMKGSYSDIGGSGLSRIFISVKNDSGDHVNSSPVVLAPEDLAFSRVIELIPGKNTIMLHAKDKAGNCDSIVGTIVYYEPKATKVIDRKGGTVDNPDGASVAIPADAVLDQVEVTIVPVEPVEQRKPLNKTLKLLNVAHDFGPDGTTFRIPVTVKLPYTEADLDLDQNGVRDVNPTSLIVVFWDGRTWHSAGPSTVDTATGTVSVNVNHFTIFDLAVSNAQVSTELITLWTANPVKNSKGAFFKYKVPEAGTVGLRIVDMAGDLVYQLIADKTPAFPDRIPVSVEWRGQNVSERFAGVGMYVYIFTYTTTGTNKTTVIRKPIGVLK